MGALRLAEPATIRFPIGPQTVNSSPAEAGPSPVHLSQIADARLRIKPISRAATVAIFNGWSLIVFALLTLATSLTSPWSVAGGLGLAAIAHFEFRGAKELRRLDIGAPRRLMINQLALGALLLIYAVAGICSSLSGANDLSAVAGAGNDPAVQQMLGPIDSLTRSIMACVYGVIGVVAVIVPGVTAMFYLRRRSMIDQYLQHTPGWIVELQQRGSTI
jgi:hypothetical protein